MASDKAAAEPTEAQGAGLRTIVIRIVLIIGSLVLLGVFLQPDSIKSLDLQDVDATKAVFFGGQPHVVLCDSSRKDASETVARVSQAAIVLQSGAGGKIMTVSANCTQPMVSGRSIVDRFQDQLQVKSRRSSKPRLPSPLGFTVANGQPPVVIPPALLKGRLPPGSEARDTATTSADVALLVATVKANTGLRKINRIKSSSSLTKCIASARRCAVLLYSLPLPKTSTKNPWTHGLDGSKALKAAREAHRDVQFSVLNTTSNGIKGVPAALKQLLPPDLGSPVQGGLNAALTSAPGALIVLSPITESLCPLDTAATASQHSKKGRHLASVHVLQGEPSAAALSAALYQAEADANAVQAMPGQQRCAPGQLTSSSVRVLKSALKVFQRQSQLKGSAIKAETPKRKRTPPSAATPAPTRPASSAQKLPPAEAAAAAADQSAREAAARAAMDQAAREFVPEYLEEEGEEELQLDDEIPFDAEEDFDVEEIEL